MSGIAGIIRFDGTAVEPGLIEQMTAAMAHRGPDGIAHWQKGSVALGQCMLRTTAESLEESQPLANEDASLVLVMNGRVDNWEALRRELLSRGAVLRNRSDAELVLRAYETWGKECLPHIDGDFALVIWDARRHAAFCARDRLGMKPFNYCWNGRTFAFASEPHPLLRLPWVERRPNEGMLSEFLAADFHSRDETLWQGITRLVAAHRMEVGAGGPRPERYWEPDLRKPLPYRRDDEYVEHYRELVTDSVRRLSRSHRQVAVEVSGGLDSSAILSIGEYLRRNGALPAPAIQGYTLDFSGDERANELKYARALSNHLGAEITELAPSMLPLAWFAERARAWSKFPGFANGTMAQNLLRRAALDGSRVILNGGGGDEWLSGTRAYYAEELAQRNWAILYDCFRRDCAAFGMRQATGFLLRHGLFPLTPDEFQNSLRQIVRRRTRRNDCGENYWLSAQMQESIRSRRNRQPKHQVAHAGQRDLIWMLHDAYRAGAMEEGECFRAEFALEARDPLSTAEFVQFALSVPERMRLRGAQDKYIHIQAMQELMPRCILERGDKAEFSVMFRRHLDRMEELFTVTLPRERPDWLNGEGMKRLYRAYRDNPRLGWPMWILWGIYGCNEVLE